MWRHNKINWTTTERATRLGATEKQLRGARITGCRRKDRKSVCGTLVQADQPPRNPGSARWACESCSCPAPSGLKSHVQKRIWREAYSKAALQARQPPGWKTIQKLCPRLRENETVRYKMRWNLNRLANSPADSKVISSEWENSDMKSSVMDGSWI